ncbi:MAG: hypothetical protein GY795_46295 [Desulfobacterales bacterium]|nr:hypothetical protein [Desulfobacterales bacterium]
MVGDIINYIDCKFVMKLTFLICLFFFHSCIPCATYHNYYANSGDMTVTEALDQKRLATIRNCSKLAGTGGPRVTLPNGLHVNSDNIIEAIQPLVKQNYAICPDLLKALKSRQVHIRYGAFLALRQITESELPYYPFFPSSNPENTAAYEKWKKYIERLLTKEK